MTTRQFRGIDYTPTIASSNNQTLIGTQGADWLEALGGNNLIFARSGNDVVLAGIKYGSIENLSLFGGQAIFYDPLLDEQGNSIAGNNWIDVGSGDDYVATGSGNDTVFLGDGNDISDGSNGNDLIIAGAGNDTVSVFASEFIKDLVSAGSGDDTVFLFSPVGGDYWIDGGSGNDDLAIYGSGQIFAGFGDDVIGLNIGAFVTGDSTVYASSGKDTIYAYTGDNLLYGGANDDTIISGIGSDIIYTGEGNDVVNLRGDAATLRGHLAEFINESFGAIPSVVGGGKDKVYLGHGKDTIVLGSGDGFKTATIYGFGASDRLDVGGLDVALSHNGCNTIVSAGSNLLATLKGYTGYVSLV